MVASGHTTGEEGRSDLELALERTADAPALARAAINGFCHGRDFSPNAISTLVLLVSEVVTNAVIHPDDDLREPITVYAKLMKDAVRVEVKDAGPRFSPQPRNPDRVDGGYGLYLLEQEAARWGVGADASTTVWFEVASNPA
jgi:anti-sigma regulatory factor (Ser/Thr protein kinase)